MSIYAPGDGQFVSSKHSRFGPRLFTVAHSAKEGKIALIGSGVCVLLIGLFFLVFSYNAAFFLSMLPAVIAMIGVPLGIATLVRSKQVVHVHEDGIVQNGTKRKSEVAFGRVTAAALNLTTELGTYNMKFQLAQGRTLIAFGDGAAIGMAKALRKMDGLVEHIVSRLPENVVLEGLHNVERSGSSGEA